MKINFVNPSKKRLPKKFIQAWVRYVAVELTRRRAKNHGQLKSTEVTLVFMGTAEAKKLNRQYRKKDYATDILSFESETKSYLGELVFCTPVVVRQAKEHGLSFQHELAYLLTHGVLHLLGYDHEKSRRHEKQMLDLQDQVFEKGLLTTSSRS